MLLPVVALLQVYSVAKERKPALWFITFKYGAHNPHGRAGLTDLLLMPLLVRCPHGLQPPQSPHTQPPLHSVNPSIKQRRRLQHG